MAWAKAFLSPGGQAVEKAARASAARDMADPSRFGERLGKASLPRANAPLVWFQTGTAADIPLAESLAQGLGDQAEVLVTAPLAPDEKDQVTQLSTAQHQYPPLGIRSAVSHFLDHWAPDVIVWAAAFDDEEVFRLSLSFQAPQILINLGPQEAASLLSHRRVLHQVAELWCTDAAAREALTGLGLAASSIQTRGPLKEAPRAPGCNDADLQDMKEVLGVRPVWLAACPTEEEVRPILDCHDAALRLAHRALLILVPAADMDADALTTKLKAEGWAVKSRADMEDVAPDTTVYVAEPAAEMGLWYRLAPVTYLGGTLSTGAQVPASDAAMLGSAMIAGPIGGQEATLLDDLEKAQAVRRIKGHPSLSRAVSDVLAPHKAANLAHNAWAQITAGTEALDNLTDTVRGLLEKGTKG